MPPRVRCLAILALLVSWGVASWGEPRERVGLQRFELRRDEVVVFLGGANMLHLQQAGYLEAILTHQFAAARPKFRDLTWEADTVFQQGTVIERWRNKAHFGDLKGLGDLGDQLNQMKATVVVAQFGQMESLAGADGVEDFSKAYEQLLDGIQDTSRRIVLITPTPFEPPPQSRIPDLSKRNEVLALYVQAIQKIASERDLLLIDLFTDAKLELTSNGLHIKTEAQSRLAAEIARQLKVDIPDNKKLEPLRRAVIERHRLWYDYWRPANWKLLYGDDARRQFTRGGNDQVSFREEWERLVPLIEKAEERIWRIAAGEEDPGPQRPKPEVLHGDPSADIEAELAAFTAAEGMQVNLFASEEYGLTSPLAIRWDPAGRMYVTVTTTYPHVHPGDLPNDKIIVLEDTDADGRADKSTLFADGLNIPTGLELGDGGVYVGQNTELLFLKDTDGDGKAESRRVVLSGFGNGDSHQTINSFVWSPGGELYFGHGDGCESRVETPWGVSSLYQAGFFRFRPRRLQLHPLLDDFMGPGNPWGVAFDRWGQIFSIDGAGGVTYLSPGQVPVSHRLRLRTIGQPGGYCGIGYLDGRNLPDSMQGDFAIGDFKANRVKRFSVESDGAGYKLHWKEHLLQSRHRNFRPVDVKVGPDGAIYVVDWYNPITCHQDDAYRDPRRDKAHGRIWRISAKSSTKAVDVRPPNLMKAPIKDVLDGLTSPEHWTRYQAKRALTARDPAVIAKALDVWVRALDPKLPDYEHHLYEALGAYATIEVAEPILLNRLLHARDYKARAYAARMVGRWHDRLDGPLNLLAERVVDEHPLVRMEAVLACGATPSPQSVTVAALAIDYPMDEWIKYAFTQSVRHLKPHWLLEFQRGEVSFARSIHIVAVLNESGGGREVIDSLRELAESDDLDAEQKFAAIDIILAVGDWNDWQNYGLNPKHFRQSDRYDTDAHAMALETVIDETRVRDVRPQGDVAPLLDPLMDPKQPKLHAAALTLAGIWKVEAAQDKIVAVAKDEAEPVTVRAAAFGALVDMQLSSATELLTAHAQEPHALGVRSAAIQSLAAIKVKVAARHAAEFFAEPELSNFKRSTTLKVFLNQADGGAALAAALRSSNLSPEAAQRLLRSLYSSGRTDSALLGALNEATGAAGKTPDYSNSYVNDLVANAAEQGDAERGKLVYHSMACASCHKIGGGGGEIGPDLTAIGTTLSAERIAEELLWPSRQIKEGFSTVEVVTIDGQIRQGIQRRTKESADSGDLVLQDLATRRLEVIPQAKIDELRVLASPMPAGLAAVLTKPQTLDLIRYLTKLGTLE